MDNGQTQNQLDMEQRLRQSNPGTSDPFASAITPGVGLIPEEYNSDMSMNPNSNTFTVATREDQANIGSRAMGIDSYLPNSSPDSQASLAGINNANRANSIGDIQSAEPVIINGATPETVLENQINAKEATKEPEAPKLSDNAPEQSESHDIIDYGKHFTTRDIELVESTIKKSGGDISSLYEKVQNTREEKK